MSESGNFFASMERACCEHCGERQPSDWQAGELCSACGAAVRRDVRCAWCAEWTPAGKYCRGCGSELVDPLGYGAARMLKGAGVDGFSLAARLRELPAEQRANLGRIYASQQVVVAGRIEETRYCQSFCLQQIFAGALEDLLLPSLPMEKNSLAVLAGGPRGPFQERPDRLAEISATSPLPLNRTLASIALFRQGTINREILTAVEAALSDENTTLSLEAALCFGHWRIKAYSGPLWRNEYLDSRRGFDRRMVAEKTLAALDNSKLAPWAAAAWAHARHGRYGRLPAFEDEDSREELERLKLLRACLTGGLGAREADLCFSCALALGEMELVAEGLHSPDESKRSLSRHYLATHRSPAIANCLTEASPEILPEILDDLSPPLPLALEVPVLETIEGGDAGIRRKGTRLLLKNLTDESVRRLVKVAQQENDQDMLQILLKADELPGSELVVRAALEKGWLTELRDELPGHVDFSDAFVRQQARSADPEDLKTWLRVAEWQLSHDSFHYEHPKAFPLSPQTAPGRCRSIGLFLKEVAFGTFPPGIRQEAFRLLDYYTGVFWNWVGLDPAVLLFQTPEELFLAIAGVFQESELHSICYQMIPRLQEKIVELIVQERVSLQQMEILTQALLSAIVQDYAHDPVLHKMILELLLQFTQLHPAENVRVIIALMGDTEVLRRGGDLPGVMLNHYEQWIPQLRHDHPALTELVDVLLHAIETVGSFYSYQMEALSEMLGRMMEDFPDCHSMITFRLALLEDSFSLPRRLQEQVSSAKEAASLAAQQEKQGKAKTGEPLEEQSSLEYLDQAIVLLDDVFPTLGAYVSFLKAMGTASDPISLMQQRGIRQEQYLKSVEAWCLLICNRDDLARRYGQLFSNTQEKPVPNK